MGNPEHKRAAHRRLVERILSGPGKSSPALRHAAFDNKGLEAPTASLVGKVALQPTRVTDADIQAASAHGLSEDEIFELVICAAVGQSSRQYESALRALDQATAAGGGTGAS